MAHFQPQPAVPTPSFTSTSSQPTGLQEQNELKSLLHLCYVSSGKEVTSEEAIGKAFLELLDYFPNISSPRLLTPKKGWWLPCPLAGQK